MALDLVDQLLDQTGLYLGTTSDTRGDAAPQAARILVTALPGGCGVSFDYEGLNLATSSERKFGHLEHALLARTGRGLALYTAHIHAPVLTELSETEPGAFEPAPDASPFPMTIRIEVPAAGRLLYTWSFGQRDDTEVRIIGDVALVEHHA